MARPPLLLAAAALAALALAACGGDGGEGAGGKPPQQVVDAGRTAQGRQVFGRSCAACHGGDGGGGTGPRLAGEAAYTDPDVVVEQVRNGGGGMPAFSDRLSEQELADVSAFVVRELAR
ncbi:MAG TPA: cytochrome c [Solirubrobacteraceae bacterium]|jgi:mono/diheme cytochrome c family protein|nr:cytochrome c [Solirubrobacteraceae bacterium]